MNDHSKDSQTRYLREAAIVLAKEGFQLDEVHTDRLCILLDGSPLCEVTGSGGVAYRNEDIDEPERIAAKDKVYEIVRNTAEYMRQMEIASIVKFTEAVCNAEGSIDKSLNIGKMDFRKQEQREILVFWGA